MTPPIVEALDQIAEQFRECKTDDDLRTLNERYLEGAVFDDLPSPERQLLLRLYSAAYGRIHGVGG
jgi:hypothetical protein